MGIPVTVNPGAYGIDSRQGETAVKFGPYEILERTEVEGGGFDALARDGRSEKEVRLWVGAEGSGRAPELEALRARLAKVYQASLPRVLGSEVVEGRAVLAVQPYRGETLAARLERGPLELLDALDVAKGVGAGLTKAHLAGVVHGAVTEREIFLAEDGRALLLHLGFGPFLGPRAPRAPEDLEPGEAEASADVFGLSRILHRCVLGVDPFERPDPEETRRALREGTPPSAEALREDLPEGLRRFLARAVRRDRTQRIHRAEEFAGDLRVLRASWDSLSSAPPRPLVPFPPVFHVRGLVVALLVLLGLVLGLRACAG